MEKLLVLSNILFCHKLFDSSAAAASECVYMWERVKSMINWLKAMQIHKYNFDRVKVMMAKGR